MTTIDLSVIKDRRKRAVQRARERNIIIPTYAQMKDPTKIPAKVKTGLMGVGLWDVHPLPVPWMSGSICDIIELSDNFPGGDMTTIDLSVIKDRRKRAVQRARERNIIIPTYAQMKDPTKIPAKVRAELKGVGLWDVAPRNLFRITWHNEPKESGGGFGGVNYPRAALQPDRCPGAHHRPGRQVVPDRGAQGRRGLRLPGPPPGHRPVRPDDPEGRLALDRQLLPRRRLRLRPAGLQLHRHPAGRHEPGSASSGSRRSPARRSRPPAPSPTSRRSSTSAGSCASPART